MCAVIVFPSFFYGGVCKIERYFDCLPMEALEWIKEKLETIKEDLEAKSTFSYISIQLSYDPDSEIYTLLISDRSRKIFMSPEEILEEIKASKPAP